MSGPSETPDLWLHVEGEAFTVSCPKRFREQIRFFPADRLVVIDEAVLRWGLFVGAAQVCPLRLESLPAHAPQFAVRFDKHRRMCLVGFSSEVFHNGEELSERTVVLCVGDTIICDPYLLRVVSPPDPSEMLQGMVEQMLPANAVATDIPDNETDFLLNVR
ncbi:MAG: hypothetical protein ACKV2Q_27210 [Planctomycetaceae bacterium]